MEGSKELRVLAVGPEAHRSNEKKAMIDIGVPISVTYSLMSKQCSRSNPTAQDLPRGSVKVEEGSAFTSCGGGSQACRQQSLCTRQIGGRAKQHR